MSTVEEMMRNIPRCIEEAQKLFDYLNRYEFNLVGNGPRKSGGFAFKVCLHKIVSHETSIHRYLSISVPFEKNNGSGQILYETYLIDQKGSPIFDHGYNDVLHFNTMEQVKAEVERVRSKYQ